ncbi:MAG TPA: LysM peptidoglycan-binding domain-containing protein [Phototrophicaceae bacterium]|nr:LysM peptidoglycan-binding domain-containing protein [Phototrophicaceae bacterium]
MRKKSARIFVSLLLLLLAGCYQQAGEQYQPANSTEIPINVPEASGEAFDLTSFPATATLPPITIIAPTRMVAVTMEATAPETGLPTVEAPTLDAPTLDLIPTEAVATNAFGPLPTSTVPLIATASGFITPSGLLGPVTPIVPTPTSPVLATATPSGLITPTAFAEVVSDDCTYTVQPGDNLYRIAVNHNTTLPELRAANPEVVGDFIQPGQVLQLSGCTPGDSPDTAGTAPDNPTSAAPVLSGETYTIQSGDTLFKIAQRFNTTVQAIVDANSLIDPERLSVGQEIIIPAPAN